MLSLAEVYQEHSRTVYRYLLTLTHDAGLAEELTQETFYQAVKSAGRFDGSCKVTTWLCAIAKNVLYAYGRKHPPRQQLDENLPAGETADRALLDGEARVELLRRLHGLAGEMREVMYLRLFGDLSFREIGDILDKSENWARVTFYRGKEKLKKEWDADGK